MRKENLRSENEEYKIMKLRSVNSNQIKDLKNKTIFFSVYNIKSEILLSILHY